MIKLVLPEPPSANVYWRSRMSFGTVKPRAVTYRSAEANSFARVVQAEFLTAGVSPLAGDVVVTIDWYRERKSGDIDNRIKPLLDAMNGLAYRDDKQVKRVVATRYDDDLGARVIVTVYPWANRTAADNAAELTTGNAEAAA